MESGSVLALDSFIKMVDVSLFWVLFSVVMLLISKRLGLFSHPLKVAHRRLARLSRYFGRASSRILAGNGSRHSVIAVREILIRITLVKRAFNIYLYDRKDTGEVMAVISDLTEAEEMLKRAAYDCYEDNVDGAAEKIGIISQTIKSSTVKIASIIRKDEESNKLGL